MADLDGLAETVAAAGHPVRWDDELPGVGPVLHRRPFGNRIELIAG